MRVFWLSVLFIFLWNSGFISAKFGLPYAGPWTLLLWRYLLLSALLGLWLLFSKRFNWPGFSSVINICFIGILAHGVWLACVHLALDMGVATGIVALITSLQPMLTGAFSGFVLPESTKPHQWLGLVLGLLGVVLAVSARLNGSDSSSTFAYLIPFGSVLAITIASLFKRKKEYFKKNKKNPLDINLFYQACSTTLFLLFPAWAFENFNTNWNQNLVLLLLWLVIAVSFGAYWAMWRLLSLEQATRVASLFYFSPPVTMLMAWFAFENSLLYTDIIALSIVGLSVCLVYLSTIRRKLSV